MALRKDEREAASVAFFRFFTGRDTAALDVTTMETHELQRHLRAIGGPNPNTQSGIDLTQAARTLGLPRRTLERYLAGERRPTATNADLIRQTSRKAQGRAPEDPHKKLSSLLEVIGGTSKRTKSGIDVAKASKRLGVSPGTVRRWINQGKEPNPDTLKKLHTTARRMTNTKRGRATALKDIRAHQVFTQPMRIDITAEQGPGGASIKGHDPGEYVRDRRTYFDVSADEANDLLNLYQDGGADAVHDWVNEMLGQRYHEPGWGVASWSVPGGGLSIRPRPQRGSSLPSKTPPTR